MSAPTYNANTHANTHAHQAPVDKIWLKNYPEGVPASLNYDQFTSLSHLLDTAYTTYKDRVAYHCMGKDMTFAQLDTYSKQIAAWLRSKGLQQGDRVAIMLPNILQYPCVTAGVIRAGMVCVNVNPLYTAPELKHQLNDSGAKAIVVLENFASVLETVLPETQISHVVVTGMGDLLSWWKAPIVNYVVRKVKKLVPRFDLPAAKTTAFNSMMRQAKALSAAHYQPVVSTMNDFAFLQYTGGTTGVSKGAALTHRNIVSNALQVAAWKHPAQKKLPDNHQMVFVCALPLYHIFALTVCNLAGAQLGAKNILIPNPRDLAGLIKTLKGFRINIFPAVNTLFNALANHADFKTLDFSQLVISNGGGMAVTHATADKWRAITGCCIAEGYGLSETSPVATSNIAMATEYSGTVGLPMPDTEVVIRDPEGNNLPIGETGEICIRGPQVMQGYWNRADETVKVMYRDGFFRSGDLGFMDMRGHVKIVDRIKNMILVSGFNVYPSELEDVITMHPGIVECAAIGIPHETCGEVPRVYVVKKDPALTAAEVMDFAAQSLTNYKRPKSVVFVDSLPKTNVGKILHRELRDLALKQA
jgi:long-chain acyl-CoA synthetase